MKIVKFISLLSLILMSGFANFIDAAQQKPTPKPAPAKPAPAKKPTPKPSKPAGTPVPVKPKTPVLSEAEQLQLAVQLSEADAKQRKEEQEAYERALTASLEEQGKRSDEAARIALKNVGWMLPKDAKLRDAWTSYQKFEESGWNKVEALGEPSVTLAYNYGVADNALPNDQQKILRKLMDFSIPALIGSARLTESQLRTLTSVIDDIEKLSSKEEIKQLVATTKPLAQQAARRSHQARTEFEQKKRHEASAVKKINIVWIDVTPQSNATCGLHALNNPHKLKESLKQKETPAQRAERMNPKNPSKTDTMCILAGASESNMLDPHVMVDRAEALAIPRNSYTILPSILQNVQDFTAPLPLATPTTPHLPESNNLADAIEELQTKPYFIHNFALGSMVFDPVSKTPIPGHYIGVTAERNGDTLTLYAMDSLKGSRPQELVEALQEIIQGVHYKALKVAYDIDERLASIRRNIRDKRFFDAFTELATITKQAQDATILNAPAFSNFKSRLLSFAVELSRDAKDELAKLGLTNQMNQLLNVLK